MAILTHSRAEEASNEATTTTTATEDTTLEGGTKTTTTTGTAEETKNTKPLRDVNEVDIPTTTISLEEILKQNGTDRRCQILNGKENCLEV